MGAIQEKEITQFSRIDLEKAVEDAKDLAYKPGTDAKSLAILNFLSKIDLAAFDKNVKSVRVYLTHNSDGTSRYRFAFTHYLPPSALKIRDAQVQEATLKDEIVAIERDFAEAKHSITLITHKIQQKREELGKIQSTLKHLSTPTPNRVKHKPGPREGLR